MIVLSAVEWDSLARKELGVLTAVFHGAVYGNAARSRSVSK